MPTLEVPVNQYSPPRGGITAPQSGHRRRDGHHTWTAKGGGGGGGGGVGRGCLNGWEGREG